MTQKRIIIGSIFLCSIAFISPFILEPEKDLLSILSVSFTALGAIATVLTLVIAIILYQRFSIDTIVVERQTSKVLELIDLLKGKVVNIETNRFTFYSRFTIDKGHLFKESYYKEMAGMALVVRESDFHQFVNPILNVSNSYWMPAQIKKKIEFLKITGFISSVNPEELKKYAKLVFNEPKKDNEEWKLIWANLNELRTLNNYPIKIEDSEMLVNDYIAAKNELVKAIEHWLKDKTSITIELEMDLPNQVETNIKQT